MFTHQLREFYVYVHRHAKTGAIFYVGKGWGSRGRDFRNRIPRWYKFCGATTPIVQIVDHSMSEPEALQLEAALISFIMATGGSLANVALARAPPPPKPKVVRVIRKPTIRCIDHGIDFFDFEEVSIWLMMALQEPISEDALNQALADGRRRAAGLRWKRIAHIA